MERMDAWCHGCGDHAMCVHLGADEYGDWICGSCLAKAQAFLTEAEPERSDTEMDEVYREIERSRETG